MEVKEKIKAGILMVCIVFAGSVPASDLRIGWASADITPDRSVRHRKGVSEGAMDPLTATALVLESGSGADSVKVVLIGCDLQHITDGNRWNANMRDDVREKVTGLVPEIKPEQIILMATHTHNRPVSTSKGYDKFAKEQIADAVKQAWESRKPGGISYGLGHAVVGHNRLATSKDGSSRMYGAIGTPRFSHIEGFEDHSVHLLYTWDAQAHLTGVVVNIACPSQISIAIPKFSADFWHNTREVLRERLGENLYVLPQLSAAGDQSPRVMVEQEAERRMQRLMFPDEESGRGSMGRRKQIAVRIADAVTSVLPWMKDAIEWNPVVAHRMQKIELPRGFPDPDPSQPKYPVEIHAVRISDTAMITNPFELYLDYGIRMKGRSPAIQTFVVQLAGSASYLPTRRAVAGRGYGAIPRSCVVGPAAGDELVEKSLELLYDIWR